MGERPASTEIEVKFRTSSAAALDRLWSATAIGPFTLRTRRVERQTNRYYEREGGKPLGAASLRWRVIEGAPTGLLTLKLPKSGAAGAVERLEIASELPAHVDPLDVEPPPSPIQYLYRLVGPVRLRPAFETRVVRRIMEFEGEGGAIEVALDEVRLRGDPVFVLREVEAELKDGSRDALSKLTGYLDAMPGLVREARSKHEQIIARIAAHRTAES